ncbi:MAG: hypothetical protein ACFE8A_02935 [Candidatus Hodarchaeota archaeon]
MTLERVIIGILIFIGILMCVFAVIGVLYWGLLLPFAVFLFIGGVLLVFLTIVAYFYLL